MKVIVILGFLIAFSQVEGRSVEQTAPKTTLTPLQEACLKEQNLSSERENIAGLNNKAICPEDNQNYNKFISCFWKKTDRQNQNGEINYNTVRQFIEQGLLQALGNDAAAVKFAQEHSATIVNGCKDISATTPDILVVKTRNCIVRGLNEIGEH